MRLLILVSGLVFAQMAYSASVLRTGALHLFSNGDRSFLSHSVLGPVCSTVRSVHGEPACNPALLGEDDAPSGIFGTNLFFGDDYETLYKNRDLISENEKLELAQSLLGEKKPVRFEASILLWYRAQSYAISYQPMRWTYFSHVRNQSYPDVSIHGMQEQSLQGQMGGFYTENWRTGLQVRLVDRKFVHEEFNLFQALPNIENYFQVRTQRAVFFEPGFAYELNQTKELEDWRPLIALNVSQLGFVDRNYDDVPVKPILDAGTSISPPVGFGEWEIGLNYRWTSNVSEERKYRIATLYRLALAEFYGGYDPDEWSVGFSSVFRSISAGLMYKRTDFEDSSFVEFRLVL